MSRFNRFSEIEPSIARVFVAKKRLEFAYLRLEQELGMHHKFTIKADFNALELGFLSNPLKHFDLIGETVDIEIIHGKDTGHSYLFRGLVQNVALEGSEGKHGHLVIHGASPTILLERGKRYDIFTNLTLKQTFGQVCDEVKYLKQQLPFVNDPIYKGHVEFLMQYNESDWDFLRRISSISNENLYWTGRDLVFGTHREFPTLEATYDREITSFEFGNKYLPNNFTRYQYLPVQDDTISLDAPAQIRNANNYVKATHERSKSLVETRPVNTPSSLTLSDAGALHELVEREKVSRASETVYIKGKAKTPHARIGRLLTIKMPNTMLEATNLGTYRITKVVHTFHQNDKYEAEFEGIPADLKAYPAAEVVTPSASSIRTTVITNEDPLGLGRVRVNFPFASDRFSDVWLRVMSPSAGSSKEVAKNRGMLFIPEKDDQVMLGFEFGDPNRPYIMGSMYHGKNTTGGGANNAIKSIITSSGHTIEFNDDKGACGITITDKNENRIHMDTNAKSIQISALEKISLVSKDIEITAKNQLLLNSDKDTIQTVGTEYRKSVGGNASKSYAKDLNVNVNSDMQLTTNQNLNIMVMGEYVQTVSQNIKIASSSIIEIQSQEDMTLKSGSNVFIAD